jgi:hypothetical protein
VAQYEANKPTKMQGLNQPAASATPRRDPQKTFGDNAAAIRTGVFRRLGQDMNLHVASENDEDRNYLGPAPALSLATKGMISLERFRLLLLKAAH